jgi:phosphohistidine phosphatase
MLRLLILRHSKAAAHAAGGDVQRPLTRRGRKDAQRIGEYLRAENLIPGMALVSAARRTRETLEIVLHALAAPVAVEEKKKLYLAEPRTLLDSVQKTPDRIRTLLVVGHNPGLAALASELACTGDPDALAQVVRSFPTSALAIVEFEATTWADVAFGTGRLDCLVTPDSLDEKEGE